MCSVSDDRTVRIWDLSLAFAKHSRSVIQCHDDDDDDHHHHHHNNTLIY